MFTKKDNSIKVYKQSHLGEQYKEYDDKKAYATLSLNGSSKEEALALCKDKSVRDMMFGITALGASVGANSANLKGCGFLGLKGVRQYKENLRNRDSLSVRLMYDFSSLFEANENKLSILGNIAYELRLGDTVDTALNVIGNDYGEGKSQHNVSRLEEAMYMNFREIIKFYGDNGILPKLFLRRPDNFGTEVMLTCPYTAEIDVNGSCTRVVVGYRLIDKENKRYDFIINKGSSEGVDKQILQKFKVVGRGNDEEYTLNGRVFDGNNLVGYTAVHSINGATENVNIGRAMAIGLCGRGLIPACSVDAANNTIKFKSGNIGNLPKVAVN